MKRYLVLCLVLHSYMVCSQRVPPGVSPQHYQQQQYQPQQFQQVPSQHNQHFEQPNAGHFQQPPPQHQQVHQHQQHQQQAPVHQNAGHQNAGHQNAGHQNVHHGHGQPHQQAHVLNTANIEHEKEHIAEHLDIPLDTKDMTTEQLQFYYFQMHDADRNNKLDGCELIKSLIHWHEQGSKGGGNNIEERIFKDEELVTLIDPILNMDDINHDGFIDYPEFIQAQRKAAAAGSPPKQ